MHTLAGPGRVRGRILTVIAALAAAAMLCACDAFYEVVVENHTGQQLTVHIGAHRIEVEPCSVWYAAAMSASPRARALAVKATDREGNVVFEDRVAAKRISKGLPRLHVVVSLPHAGDCPAQMAAYSVSVRNDSDRDLQVIRGEEVLGHVAAHSAADFGPVPALWGEAPFPDVRDPQGGGPLHGDLVVESSLDSGASDVSTYRLWVRPANWN